MTDALARELHALAGCEPGERVLSLYARTDPRDPANTNHVPGWLIAASNHLRALQAGTERDGDRDQRLAVRELVEQAQQLLEGLEADQRGRSVALFLTPSGRLERRLTLQFPVRADGLMWDERPVISPLVDVADRGRATGLVLVGGEHVRLLHWEHGRIEEPDGSTCFSRRGAERCAVRRGADTAAARAHHRHRRGQPDPGDVAARLEPVLERAWRREVEALIADVLRAADGDRRAVAGPAMTLAALAEHRVEHLLVDLARVDTTALMSAQTRAVLRDAPASLSAERAVKAAIATGARVTAPAHDVDGLAQVEGMAARLRW